MAGTAEEAVFSALRGHLSENTKLPTPLIIKVYVASLKKGMYAQRVQFIVGEASFAVVCISYYGRHESFDTTAVCVCVCVMCVGTDFAHLPCSTPHPPSNFPMRG